MRSGPAFTHRRPTMNRTVIHSPLQRVHSTRSRRAAPRRDTFVDGHESRSFEDFYILENGPSMALPIH